VRTPNLERLSSGKMETSTVVWLTMPSGRACHFCQLSVPKILALLIPEILARPAIAERARTLPMLPVDRPAGDADSRYQEHSTPKQCPSSRVHALYRWNAFHI
jgi:hypothetical protein